MKRSIAALLAAVLLLALAPCGAFAASKADAEKVYSYKTDTLRETDRTYEEAGFTARVTVPNVLGTVKAHIETRYGSADSDVLVLYIPKDEWDGDCAYGVLSARLRSKSLSVYPGSDLVIAWKDMYQYGFIDTEGGLYTFDKDTLEMHFTAGPGLYTGVAAIPVAAGDPLGKTYEEALAAADAAGIELDYLALGYNFILALDDDMIAYYLEHGTLDRVSTYAWPGLDDLLEETRYEVQPVVITPGVHNFSIKKAYLRGQFLDMPYREEHWYDEYVGKSVSYGLMGGYTDGLFRPEGNITLAECLVIACNMHDVYEGGSGVIPQAKPYWYSGYVNYALLEGIIRAGDFTDLDAKATRGQVCYIFSRMLPAEAYGRMFAKAQFTDVGAGSQYADSISLLQQAGIIGGYPNGTFRPGNSITRAEVCVMIANVLRDAGQKPQ